MNIVQFYGIKGRLSREKRNNKDNIRHGIMADIVPNAGFYNRWTAQEQRLL
jgi:hypothetical protein